MAANDFTPTGDSPRTSDDSDGIKSALVAALAAQDDTAEGDDAGEAGGAAPKGDETKKPEAEDGKKTDDEIKTPPAEKKDEVEAKKTAADDKKTPETEGDKSNEPPTSWSAKDKDTFKGLPKPAQSFLLDRHRSMEADYTRKTQELSTLRKDYEAVDQIFTPQRDRMKQAGVTASQLIQGWYNMESVLQSGNFDAQAKLIAGATKSYNIDPIKLATQILVAGGVADPKAALEQAAAAAAQQPQPVALPPEVMQRLDKADRTTAAFEARERERADTEVARINSDLDKFKAATDDKGALLHPHFDELVETMSQLVDQATAAKRPVPAIDQLYQEAIFANPAVRQKWLDAKLAAERSTTDAAQQVAREKAAAEARAKSEKARRAGSSVTGAPGTGQPLNGVAKTGNLRSAIAAAVEDQETVVH